MAYSIHARDRRFSDHEQNAADRISKWIVIGGVQAVIGPIGGYRNGNRKVARKGSLFVAHEDQR